ncbi:MAG: YggT family protein [Anaerolineae bacterium]
MQDFLLNTVNLLFTALTLVIIARVLLSWFPQYQGSTIARMINDISEPILRPIHNVIPPMGMLDMSPMIAIILLMVLQTIITTIIQSLTF